MFLPAMTSRLMLSLKKAATEPTGMWSLSTMGDFRRGRFPGQETIQFASYGFNASYEIQETLPPPNGEDIELDFMPQSPRDRGSQQLC